MASMLTQEDVARLLQEPSPLVRAEVAGKLAQELDSPLLTEQELELAQEIIRLMVKDVEVCVRQSLSESLRRAVRLPHDVAVKLANDVDSVALPILENSTVLTDDDLIAVVQNGQGTKQEAIAARTNVSEKLSDVLINSASEKAVSALMTNATARISEISMGKAVDRFEASDAVKNAMVKRASLPITVAERLTVLVSDQMRDYLVTHHELSAKAASDIVLQSRERTVINMVAAETEQDIEKLVLQMFNNKRLTPSIVLRALCMGDIAFFEASLAVMANVPLINARILIHDAGFIGLKSLYEKAGMPPRLLSAVRVALDVVHETEMDGGQHDRERYRARVIERVLTQFENMGDDDVNYLLDKLGDVMNVAVA